MESPMQIISLIMMPLMFASNTFFPISLMPDWMQAIARVNPLSYVTDAVRQLTILPLDASALIMDFTYLGIFAAVLAAIGIVLSWRYLTSKTENVKNMATIVEAVNLKKTYMLGKVPVEALRGVNLKVEEGEFLAFWVLLEAENPRFLNLIGALDKPTEGHGLHRRR
jgi:hypothetical protein